MSRLESAARLPDRRAALVVVDVQTDFADPRGSLYVQGGAEVIAVIVRAGVEIH